MIVLACGVTYLLLALTMAYCLGRVPSLDPNRSKDSESCACAVAGCIWPLSAVILLFLYVAKTAQQRRDRK